MPIHISGYLYEWKAAIRILKLYIIPEHNQADKKRNVETLNLANAIKAQKILEIYNQTYGFNHNRLSNMKLTGYMKLIAEQSVNIEYGKVPYMPLYAIWKDILRMEYC